MIKLIIFDAGDILYDWKDWFVTFDKEIKKFFTKHKLNLPENYHDFWDTDEISKAARVGKINLREAHRRFLKILKVPEKFLNEYEELDKKALKSLKVKDLNIRETLLKLKKMGYKLAILSDTPHTRKNKEMILELVGLGGLFDGIFVSSEIKVDKPNPQAYIHVLKYFNLNPSEAVFVAHDEDELVGAKKVGIKTISYQGHDSANFIIQSFKEIIEILGKIK